jgi:hypothetical protein
MATITSASSVFMLAVDTVFPTPVRLEGYAVNDAFIAEPSEIAETQVGVDGVVVSGWLPRLTRMAITFLASSPSVDIFEEWMRAEDQITDILYASGQITIPALSKIYYLPQGTLQRVSIPQSARRVLEQRVFDIIWGFPITVAPTVPS